jgi:hypothetical protein
VVASLGPWNPTALAIHSQLNRFQALLAIKDDEAANEQPVLVTPGRPPVDQGVQRQLLSIADFIVARGAQAKLAALLPRAPAWATERPTTWRERRELGARILADFGVAADIEHEPSRLEFRNPWFRPGLTVKTDQVRFVVWLQVTRQGIEPPVLQNSAGSISLAYDHDRQALEAIMPDGSTVRLALAPKMQQWSRRLPEKVADFTLEARTADHRLRLILQQMRAERRQHPPQFQVETMHGLVLLE